VSAATVKTHLHHLYEKLGVSDRTAAVAKGIRRGVVR
jgi:ATP/maltotriose-dependent transcriptional regulator MalT